MQSNPRAQSSPTAPSTSLYDQDLSAWAAHNAQLLRNGQFNELDIEHLIEELDDMGKSEQHAIVSHMRILLMHLLKWQFQANLRSSSWRYSIANARIEIADLLSASPSLQRLPQTELPRVYLQARRLASTETGPPPMTFPLICPYELGQVLGEEWLP